MADKKIKYDDIFDGEIFDKAVEGADQLLKKLNELEKQFKGILSTTKALSKTNSFENVDAIKKTVKAITENTEAVKKLDAIEVEREKLVKRLTDATNERTKANALLKVQIQDATARSKENAKIEGSLGAFEAKNALLKKLQKEYRNLATEQGIGSAKAKELLSKVQDLNKELKDIDGISKREKAVEKLIEVETESEKLKKKLAVSTSEQAKETASLKLQIQEQTRATKENIKIEGELGPYKKKSALLNKLRNEYKDLSSAEEANTKEAKELLKEVQALDKELKDLDETVGQNQRSVGNYEKAVKSLRGNLSLLGKTAVIGVLLKLVETFKGSENGAQQLSKAMLQVTVRISLFVDAISKAASASTGFASFFEQLGTAFDGFVEKADAAIMAGEGVVDSTNATSRAISELKNQVAELTVQEEAFATASDDNTLSLTEQREALANLQPIAVQRISLLVDIADKELQLAKQRRDASRAIRSDGKADADALAEVAEATLTKAEAEAELIRFSAEASKRLREIKSDDAELELDILIDAADNLKMVRERIIADESVSTSTRRKLLEQTTTDVEDSFDAQIAVIEKLESSRLEMIASEKEALLATETDTAKRLELESEIQALRERGASIIIDPVALLAETDTVALNEMVKEISLVEKIQTRLLEVIREKRTATQDLSEANRDLTESERALLEQNTQNALQASALLELQQEGANLKRVLAKLAKDELDAEIEALQARLFIAEMGSTELAEIQNQLNDKLLERQQARIEKQLKQEKQFTDASIALIRQLADKRSDAQKEAIERELTANQQRQEALRALAQQGIEEASDNLALAQRREAELQRQQEKQTRRRARVELALSAVETYSSKVEANDPNALQSTITDIAILQAFVNGLPAFFSGAENVSDSLGLPDVAGRDGYIIRADGSERIMTGAQNQMIGEMSNEQLSMLAFQHRVKKPSAEGAVDSVSYEMLKNIHSAIKQQPVYLGRDYSSTERAIVDTVARKGAIERTHKKTGGIWGNGSK